MHSATAAKLWQVAHTVMVNLHCGCTMVAGEFAGFESGYVSRYKKFMIKHSLRPHVWGMHDYHDLVQVEPPLESYKNRDAEEFAKLTSKRLRPKPRIWLSEQGVELKSIQVIGAVGLADQAFRKLHLERAIESQKQLGAREAVESQIPIEVVV